MRLYLIRHGQTDWNAEARIQGSQDIPLNGEGRRQAVRLAGELAGRGIEAVYSSPKLRALETAERIAAVCKARLWTLGELEEICYGVWEGMTLDEIFDAYLEEFKAWWEHPKTASPPGGETLRQVEARCARALERIVSDAPNGAAVVSHGGTIACLLNLLFSQETDAQDGVDNASITAVDYDQDSQSWRMVAVNDTGHLDQREE